jgi:hypothetical protein
MDSSECGTASGSACLQVRKAVPGILQASSKGQQFLLSDYATRTKPQGGGRFACTWVADFFSRSAVHFGP